MKTRIEGISVQSLLFILVFAYCVITFFVDIHADAAEGIAGLSGQDHRLHHP